MVEDLMNDLDDLMSDQDPQNDLDDPTKELYLGDQQNPEKEFYSNSTHCELSRQYPLNKLYLDEPEYKFYLGDSQISDILKNGDFLDDPQLYYVRSITETHKNWKNRVFLDDPQLYYVRSITEIHNISGNCDSTLESWFDGYIFGDLKCGFWLDNSQCDTYLGNSTGMWLYLEDLESWVYFGDLKCYHSWGSQPIDVVLCWMVLDGSNIKKVLTPPFYLIKPESLKRHNWKKRKKHFKKLFVLGRRCRLTLPFYFHQT